MLKVVLVDDEPSVLEGLLIFVDWRKIGFEIAGTASDGTAALSLICDRQPDLVVCDIRMPGLNGLELIEKINMEIAPPPKFMLLSGYSDFSYAQKALQLGALGYLSKPLDAGELACELTRAAEIIENERTAKQESAELISYTANQLYNDIMEGNRGEKLSLKAQSIFGINETSKIQIIQFVTDSGPESTASPEAGIYELLEQITGVRNENDIFYSGIGGYFIVMHDGMPIFSGHEKLKEKLVGQLKDVKPEKYGYKAFWILISDVFGGEAVESIYRCGKQLEQLKAYCLLNPQNTVVDYRTLDESPAPENDEKAETVTAFPRLPFDKVANTLKGNDAYAVTNAVDEFFDQLNKDVASRRLYSICLYRFADVIGKMAYAYGIEAGREIRNFTQAVGNLNPNCRNLAHDMCASIFKRVNSNNVKPLVLLENEIIDYIKANYNKNLSLQKIAERFSLPAIIISKIIKKKTGQKFNDYFNYLRIEYAKTLFASSDMKIASVCEASGYTDYGYFVEKFREFTGISPSEYKKKYS